MQVAVPRAHDGICRLTWLIRQSTNKGAPIHANHFRFDKYNRTRLGIGSVKDAFGAIKRVTSMQKQHSSAGMAAFCPDCACWRTETKLRCRMDNPSWLPAAHGRAVIAVVPVSAVSLHRHSVLPTFAWSSWSHVNLRSEQVVSAHDIAKQRSVIHTVTWTGRAGKLQADGQ